MKSGKRKRKDFVKKYISNKQKNTKFNKTIIKTIKKKLNEILADCHFSSRLFILKTKFMQLAIIYNNGFFLQYITSGLKKY